MTESKHPIPAIGFSESEALAAIDNTLLRESIRKAAGDIESLHAATANALVATLGILGGIFTAWANAQTLEELRDSVAPVLPLLQQVAQLKSENALLSIPAVKRGADAETIIDSLLKMTQAAKAYRAFKDQANV